MGVYSRALDSTTTSSALLPEKSELTREEEVVESLVIPAEGGDASSPPERPLHVSWKKLALRAFVSALVLTVLFTQISLSEVLSCVRGVSPTFILFAWCYYSLCQWISAYRWQLLLRAKDVHVSLGQLFAYYMIGMFVNNFLPGSIGGDVVKSYYLYRRTQKLEISVVSVFLERFTGLVGLCVLSMTALAFGYQYLHSPIIVAAVVGTSLALLLMVLLLTHLPSLATRVPMLTKMLPERVISVAGGVYESLVSYRNHSATIFSAIAISTVLQFMFAVYYALASIAMGIPVDLIYFVLFLPAVTLISLVPLSLGGLGIREAAMVVLFGAAGIAPADVLAISLTIHIINMILSLVGGVLLITHQAPPIREYEAV
jgi:uncharacterized protein (TIRG00374 family)